MAFLRHFKMEKKACLMSNVPSEKFVFFYSRKKNLVSRIVERHYDEIEKNLADKGYTFVSIPHILAIVAEQDLQAKSWVKSIWVMDILQDKFFDSLDRHTDGPVFFTYKESMLLTAKPCIFLTWKSIKAYLNQFDEYKEEPVTAINQDIKVKIDTEEKEEGVEHDSGIRFHCSSGAPERTPYKEDDDVIAVSLSLLRKAGISDDIINFIVQCGYKPSRMIVTEQGKILLPDLDVEIKMTPLDKTLYFLYLRHPEGIRFKDLCDHFREIILIYSSISPRTDVDESWKSLQSLVDPFSNSVNEKSSHIKRAFTEALGSVQARPYIISGVAGEEKSIHLDRSLVEFNLQILPEK